MSALDQCMVCKNKFNKNNNIPFMLECGETLCSSCISYYTQAYTKEEFKCPYCCNMTKSTKRENKALYPKNDAPIQTSINQASVSGEFDVTIKLLDGDRLNVKVNKNMTVGQLINEISQKTGINKDQLRLSFKKPLNDKSKTLEFYKITKTVTIPQVAFIDGGIKYEVK